MLLNSSCSSPDPKAITIVSSTPDKTDVLLFIEIKYYRYTS